ncbi:MAG: hypothetical protein KC468_13500 [Myxococcales bacterium]|nr:hypothetical protein [Myxococcales bacterium]
MTLQLEPRPYGPDSTPEEREALRARVQLLRDDIVLIRDVPVGTKFSLGVMADEIKRLTAGRPRIKILVDIADAHPPDAEYREALFSFHELEPRLAVTAIYIGHSRVLLAITKFALAIFRRHMRADAFRDRDEALRYLEHAD